MVERLKRWESPRKRGRNDKGKGGSARARQLRKKEQMMRQKLKKNSEQKSQGDCQREGEVVPSFFCFLLCFSHFFYIRAKSLLNTSGLNLAIA